MSKDIKYTQDNITDSVGSIAVVTAVGDLDRIILSTYENRNHTMSVLTREQAESLHSALGRGISCLDQTNNHSPEQL